MRLGGFILRRCAACVMDFDQNGVTKVIIRQ